MDVRRLCNVVYAHLVEKVNPDGMNVDGQAAIDAILRGETVERSTVPQVRVPDRTHAVAPAVAADKTPTVQKLMASMMLPQA